MASLRRFKDSRYWFAVYRDASGKQCNRSTKIAIAGEGDTERERGRDAAAKQRLARQIAELYEQTERSHPTEAHIQKVLFDIFAKVNKRRIEPTITERFCLAWLSKVKTRRGDGGTVTRYSPIVTRFLAGLGPRRLSPLSDITPTDIQGFVDAEAKAGKAASTVRLEHKALTALFADALKQGHIPTNPAAAVAVPLEAGETRTPFDWPQIRGLLSACDSLDVGKAEDAASIRRQWKTLILLGAYTGARLGDCATMRWENIDLPGRLVRFRPAKTKAKREDLVVPLHPDLESHLLTLPLPDGAEATKQPLSPQLAAIAVGGRAGLSRKFQDIIDGAGIENANAREGHGRGRRMSQYSFHSLRHAFNSALLNRGVGEDLRMRLSGHTDEKSNRIYSHAELATLRDAVAKLPGLQS